MIPFGYWEDGCRGLLERLGSVKDPSENKARTFQDRLIETEPVYRERGRKRVGPPSSGQLHFNEMNWIDLLLSGTSRVQLHIVSFCCTCAHAGCVCVCLCVFVCVCVYVCVYVWLVTTTEQQ